MPPGLFAIARRVALVYALMLVMIRLLGKRTIGNLTAFDMLIALVMGDLAGNAIYGQVPLTHAITAVVALSALHYELRLDGIEDLADVKVARVERDGRISVVREDWAEPARRGDLGQAG